MAPGECLPFCSTGNGGCIQHGLLFKKGVMIPPAISRRFENGGMILTKIYMVNKD